MRQLSVKLETLFIEPFILKVIFWSFGALVLLYLVFLGNMVRNIVVRQGLEIHTRALSAEVRNLEVTYLYMSNGIDLPLSYSLGFKETKVTFATRKALGLLIVQNEL